MSRPLERARIVALHPRPKSATCLSCGLPLRNAPTWWRLCAKCFAGAQLFRAVAHYRAVQP